MPDNTQVEKSDCFFDSKRRNRVLIDKLFERKSLTQNQYDILVLMNNEGLISEISQEFRESVKKDREGTFLRFSFSDIFVK